MCPHTTIYVSSYYYMCVLILLYVCPHTTMYVSSYAIARPVFFLCFFQKAMAERNCSRARRDRTQTALFVVLLATASAFTAPAPHATRRMSYATSSAMPRVTDAKPLTASSIIRGRTLASFLPLARAPHEHSRSSRCLCSLFMVPTDADVLREEPPRRARAIVISGPSGVGKGCIIS